MKKHCALCGERMQRWGTTRAGTPRFYCTACKRSSTWKRPDVEAAHRRRQLDHWLGGKDSLTEIASRYHRTRQGVWKRLRPLFSQPLEPAIPPTSAETLILDATYVHGRTLCALVAIDEHDTIYWRFAPYECYATWHAFLSQFGAPKTVVMDGQKGLFAAARDLWPDAMVQRCQFHIVSFALQYVGRKPKDEPGRAILDLLYRLKTVRTHADRDAWILLYRIWEGRYQNLLLERNENRKYANPRLRTVRYLIRRALPNLFTYLDYPSLPNTTNLVEGWVNSAVAEALRLHRGLCVHEKQVLVGTVLSHLVRERKPRPVPAGRRGYWFRQGNSLYLRLRTEQRRGPRIGPAPSGQEDPSASP